MGVRSGYKQTEVGLIPENWDVKRLEDLAELTSSKRIFESDYVLTGIPFYRGKEISRLVEGGTVDDPYFISEARYSSIKTKFGTPTRGDILITAVGTLGNVYVVDTDAPFYFKDGNLIWLRNTQGVSSRFLGIQLQRAKAAILDGAIGTSQKALTIVVLRKLPVAIPPIPEQRAIATALSDLDALLDGLTRLIAKKRDLKQATMQQLLSGRTRLPGFSGEWEVKRLGDVCCITTGKKDVNEGNPNGQYPFFTCSRSHTFSDGYSFDTEAILIAGNGEVGNLHYFKGKFEAYQRTYVLCDFSAQVGYLWQQLSCNLADSLGLGKIGSSIPYIKIENLTRFEFANPMDVSEQTAIATILADMDTELAALDARLNKTRAIKQSMMQELLTGRVRLV